LNFVTVNSTADLDAQLARAQSQNIPVLLDFYADWCTACQEMEDETFADPEIQKTLSHVLLLKADITDSTDDHKALLRRYGLIGPPATLFFREDGQEVKSRRVVGFIPPAPFNLHVIQALDLPSSTTVR
jgi:thiol:disulfide interchange protein DsbD